MRERLAVEEQGVVDEQVLDHRVAHLADRRAVMRTHHLVSEGRVHLGKRLEPLHAQDHAAVAREVVELHRLLDLRRHGVGDAAQRRVIGPDGERLLTALLQLAGVVDDVLLQPGELLHVAQDQEGHLLVHRPLPLQNALLQDLGEGGRVLPLAVHPEDRMEDVIEEVRIECHDVVGDHLHVAQRELGGAHRVIHGVRHDELRALLREGDLRIDSDHRDLELVIASRFELVLGCPSTRRRRELHVVDEAGLSSQPLALLEELRNGKFVGVLSPGGHRILPFLVGL